jgi:hypothetical protein
MAINPGIPIPSAMPRISLVERPFNGTGDDVTCGDTKLDKVVVEPKVIFRPLVILKDADTENIQLSPVIVLRNKKRNVFENVRLNP